MILHPDPPFTMRKPAYIALERLNHLRYHWGELRIFLLELGIFPKIMAWTRDLNPTAFQD
jgi:hypothetical protein